MWIDVKIRLPEEARERIFPAAAGGTHAYQARNITARLNEEAGYPLPPEFFHYDKEVKGRTMHGRPPVRFDSFVGGISVIGVGKAGVDLVDSNAHHLRRMWSKYANVPLSETRNSGENFIAAWSAGHYYIHALALDLPRPWDFDREDALDKLSPHIQKAIATGIREQVKSNHHDDHSMVNSEALSDLEPQDVQIFGMDKVGFAKLETNAQSKAALAVCRKVEFVMPMRLGGIWHVGRLPSRGYGKILRLGPTGKAVPA